MPVTYNSFGNCGSLSINLDLRLPTDVFNTIIVRSSVFENNVSRYCVVINTVSDSEISPHSHNYMVSSGLVLSQIFSNAF